MSKINDKLLIKMRNNIGIQCVLRSPGKNCKRQGKLELNFEGRVVFKYLERNGCGISIEPNDSVVHFGKTRGEKFRGPEPRIFIRKCQVRASVPLKSDPPDAQQ